MSKRTLAVSAFLAGSLVMQAPLSIAAAPEKGVTYTLQPLNYNAEDSVAAALGGALCRSGQCVNIRHPAALGDASIQAGTDNLDSTLRGDAYTSVIVAGQSQGAQSATRWLEQHGTDFAAEEDITFILIANPSRKTGFQSQNGFTSPTTEDSRYTIIDIAREYDGWAHWPDRFNVLAIVNATMGMFTVHTTYEDVLDAPTTVAEIEQTIRDDPRGERNLVWKSGGTYYVLNRTEILPIAVPLTWVGLNTAAKNLSDALRPTIDAAYDNPEQGQGIDTSENDIEDSTKVTKASLTPAHGAPPVKAESTSVTRDAEHAHSSAAEVSATETPSVDEAPSAVEKSESAASRAGVASKEDIRAERAARAESQKAERDTTREERRAARAESQKAEREAKKEAKKAEREAKKAERDTKREERRDAEPSTVRADKRESDRGGARGPSRDSSAVSTRESSHDGKRTDNGADE